ncbi:uncharacterized protein EI90DRAFT_2393178 [Cantharellus anzutake]|uniref:uncharacterized protein n=1 Tax=Cantharellus anzutake TaxID=1750568 RepID=UPI0019051B34|nr:uncharacterized protein EI90DRAFT_2393178 [Cantharellus anzutake]KAF8322972.1 hypothetical protein EI90DRAFT_2393178 [Cantharellus anzutake]
MWLVRPSAALPTPLSIVTIPIFTSQVLILGCAWLRLVAPDQSLGIGILLSQRTPNTARSQIRLVFISIDQQTLCLSPATPPPAQFHPQDLLLLPMTRPESTIGEKTTLQKAWDVSSPTFGRLPACWLLRSKQ